jgi:hypothetical protein
MRGHHPHRVPTLRPPSQPAKRRSEGSNSYGTNAGLNNDLEAGTNIMVYMRDESDRINTK